MKIHYLFIIALVALSGHVSTGLVIPERQWP